MRWSTTPVSIIDKPFVELSAADWDTVVQTVLNGTFHCCQEFAARYRGEGGHIINIGASTGIRGRKNGANYCAAKAGVLSLTKCLAMELAPKICVNCIVPGYIETEEVMSRFNLRDPAGYRKVVDTILMGRLGSAGDVFQTARFLVEEATYITGQNFFVNGGHFIQ